MADWDPSLYLQYSAERTRPAAELLARVPLADITSAVDLGCGPGNYTRRLSALIRVTPSLGDRRPRS